MAKQRRAIPKTIEKRAFQEAGSKCSFCTESEIAAIEVHHIDGNPANNVVENLFVACKSCHGKVTGGVISEATVRLRKLELASRKPAAPAVGVPASSIVSVVNSTVHGDLAHQITKITTTRKGIRIQHPAGSIGSDLERKGYVDYLIAKYFEFKKADRSYGKPLQLTYPELHTTIQRTFGFKTFFMPISLFDQLAVFLQQRIDRTILGRHNRSKGIANYHSFEEHRSAALGEQMGEAS